MRSNGYQSYVLDVALLRAETGTVSETNNNNNNSNSNAGNESVLDNNNDNVDDSKEAGTDTTTNASECACEFEWIVIEVNPIGTNCGAGLFDWVEDCALFFNNDSETHFRVKEDMPVVEPQKLSDGLGEVFQQTVQQLLLETRESKET